MNVDDIRDKFPSPGSCDDEQATYCVLGAAIMFKRGNIPDKTARQLRFPGATVASKVLDIDFMDAVAIYEANDSSNFEKAWKLLQVALSASNK